MGEVNRAGNGGGTSSWGGERGVGRRSAAGHLEVAAAAKPKVGLDRFARVRLQLVHQLLQRRQWRAEDTAHRRGRQTICIAASAARRAWKARGRPTGLALRESHESRPFLPLGQQRRAEGGGVEEAAHLSPLAHAVLAHLQHRQTRAHLADEIANQWRDDLIKQALLHVRLPRQFGPPREIAQVLHHANDASRRVQRPTATLRHRAGHRAGRRAGHRADCRCFPRTRGAN